jgi:hypothetical protein
MIELLERNGLRVESAPALVEPSLHYTRSILIDTELRGVPALLSLQNDERFAFELTSIDAGSILLGALPQVGSMIDSRNRISLEEAVADAETLYLDSATLQFVTLEQLTDNNQLFQVVKTSRQFQPPQYFYVDEHGARRIEIECGIVYMAARSRKDFVFHANEVLFVLRGVPLPILLERAVHFMGASYRGILASEHGPVRCFSPVPLEIARVIARKLLTSVNAIDVGGAA